MRQRQTKKREDGLYEDIDEGVVSNCSSKLGPYEDIEQEWGVNLSIVHRALKNGWYGKSGNQHFGILEFFDERFFALVEYTGLNIGDYNVFKLSDYGKTWALTKEELL